MIKIERCKLCFGAQRLAWSVKDEVWKNVMQDYNETVCLECFLRHADMWNIEIKKEDFLFFGWIGNYIKGDILINGYI